jgi:non-ribosomal peptide synthetase component F
VAQPWILRHFLSQGFHRKSFSVRFDLGSRAGDSIEHAECPTNGSLVLDGSDLSRRLTERQGKSIAYRDSVAVHVLLERRVVVTPDSHTVLCGIELPSYRVLDARANQLSDGPSGLG